MCLQEFKIKMREYCLKILFAHMNLMVGMYLGIERAAVRNDDGISRKRRGGDEGFF